MVAWAALARRGKRGGQKSSACILAWIFIAPVACAVTGASQRAGTPGTTTPVAAAAAGAPTATAPPTVAGPPVPAPVALTFADFFQPGTRLIPTDKILQAKGKHVRLVGFMARMEIVSPRVFYLASRPVICDEAGAGTADLTPDAVRVEVPWAREPAIAFVPGPVEVIGTFDVGGREEPDGRVSIFRVTLDSPPIRSSSHVAHKDAVRLPVPLPPPGLGAADSHSDSSKLKSTIAKQNDSRS